MQPLSIVRLILRRFPSVGPHPLCPWRSNAGLSGPIPSGLRGRHHAARNYASWKPNGQELGEVGHAAPDGAWRVVAGAVAINMTPTSELRLTEGEIANRQ